MKDSIAPATAPWANVTVGYFLAVRDIRRANIWTTSLIIFIMMLTFINLIGIRGILIGIVEGAVTANRSFYTGDVILSTLNDKTEIAHSRDIARILDRLPGVARYSLRYTGGGRVEAGYRNKKHEDDKIESIGAPIVGIDPIAEDQVSHLSKKIIDGQYLTPGDKDSILIGAVLLYKYSQIDSPGLATLKQADVGQKVRLLLGGNTREVTIKGVIKAKANAIDSRVFLTDTLARELLNRNSFNVNEIPVMLTPGKDPQLIKSYLEREGVGAWAKIQTYTEAFPQFLIDIQTTFSILGNVVGTIGLVVASITIFIVIFVNAITRRKYIGILKGIGINAAAIEISYIIQSMFYALAGIGLAVVILYLGMKPYFAAHPLNFPFSDGVFVATPLDVLTRAGILLLATIIAGFVPARIVVKQHTLDAILGR